MNCKKTTLILCLSIFLSTERNANAQTQTFSATGTVQTWTVPCTNSITITANGAQGNGDNSTGGLGAKIIGTFVVTPGHVLDIMVGKEGADDPSNGAGGGGGTFVWDTTRSRLLVAAGGGGGGTVNDAATYGGGGSADTTPTPGWGTYTAAGGVGGNGGAGGSNGAGSYSGAGGGCGWLSNGDNGTPGSLSNPAGGGGASPSNGGTGGIAAANWGAAGGYGGAGGGGISGGGGGGYNGGGGGTAYPVSPSTCGGGGGGGSYNGGTNQTNTAATNTGNGSVTIAWSNAVIPVTASGNVIANEVTCNGLTGEANAVATGIQLRYLWTGGETIDTATGLSAGSYTVTVTSACGGSASASVTITQPVNVISGSASTVSNVFCNGGSDGSALATVTGVGSPYTYSWTPSNETIALATGLTAGIYTVSMYNVCGASASATVTITQPPSLSLSAIATANVLCNSGSNGSIAATAHSGTPPYAYSWAPYGGITDSAVGLAAGTYTVTLTDANGCTGSADVAITQPNILTSTASVNNEVLCYGTSTGNMIGNVNGGTGPYTYTWTGGQTNASASGISAGTYTVNVTDNHGCTASAGGVVTQPTPLQVVENTTLDSGACTGTAWINVTGGVDPYTYLWSNGNITYYTHYVCHDTFCYKVTDTHGCADSGCIYVPTDLGVANVASKTGNLKVYPNPSNGQFTIESLVAGGQWTVEVYNVLGERVYTQSNIQNSTFNINLGSQPNGIYLYRVISSDNGSLLGEGKMEIAR